MKDRAKQQWYRNEQHKVKNAQVKEETGANLLFLPVLITVQINQALFSV